MSFAIQITNGKVSFSCCNDPNVRGGKCETCGQWMEDVEREIEDREACYDTLNGSDMAQLESGTAYGFRIEKF